MILKTDHLSKGDSFLLAYVAVDFLFLLLINILALFSRFWFLSLRSLIFSIFNKILFLRNAPANWLEAVQTRLWSLFLSQLRLNHDINEAVTLSQDGFYLAFIILYYREILLTQNSVLERRVLLSIQIIFVMASFVSKACVPFLFSFVYCWRVMLWVTNLAQNGIISWM